MSLHHHPGSHMKTSSFLYFLNGVHTPSPIHTRQMFTVERSGGMKGHSYCEKLPNPLRSTTSWRIEGSQDTREEWRQRRVEGEKGGMVECGRISFITFCCRICHLGGF